MLEVQYLNIFLHFMVPIPLDPPLMMLNKIDMMKHRRQS